MQFTDILTLIGGLALFLFGMNLMGDSLEAAAGKRLKSILEKLTSSRWRGVLVGTGLTTVIQSSSATTVMTVGFVNAGIMTLGQAIGVIMGANIGTTITGQMIALDISVIAPIIAIIGVVISMFSKKRSHIHVAQIFAGLGILFIGMGMMSDAMKPLRDVPEFVNLLSSFSNPLVGILVGALFTGIIQSSSASVGILQALGAAGVLGIENAVFVLFGMNIGTCITSVIASIGTSRNAKRVALVHLFFNIIGTVVFTTVCLLTDLSGWVASWTPGKVPSQIANMHTLFNVTTTILLFPFANLLAKLATRILPVHESEKSHTLELQYLKENNIGSVSISIVNLCKEIRRMGAIASENTERALRSIIDRDSSQAEAITKNEAYLDYLNVEITRYMTTITTLDMPEQDAARVNALFQIASDMERIGDHAENISEYLNTITEKKIAFSETGKEELAHLRDLLGQELSVLLNWDSSNESDSLIRIGGIEQEIDNKTAAFREQEIARMSSKSCSVEAGLIYSELLSDIERISDHVLNIAQALSRAKIDLNHI